MLDYIIDRDKYAHRSQGGSGGGFSKILPDFRRGDRLNLTELMHDLVKLSLITTKLS